MVSNTESHYAEPYNSNGQYSVAFVVLENYGLQIYD